MDVVRTNKKKKRTPIYIAAGVITAVAITVGLSQMEPAAPSVEDAAAWRDTVRRGDMLREVRGPGTLVPEQIRWVVAVTSGRVEQVFVLPGAKVQPGTPLLIMSNPDVQRLSLEAQQQLSNAQSQLISLKANLETQRLQQETSVASAKSAYNTAVRDFKLQEELKSKKMSAENEYARAQDALAEAKQRYEGEQKRLEVTNASIGSQVNTQIEQVESLKRILAFRTAELASMNVKSESEGVVQEFSMQVGQWVNSGTTLARVVEPGRLKAVLRIPETQAPMVVIGLPAKIDTRNGIIEGSVVRIDPAAQNGTVGVDVALPQNLPASARPDLSVDGTIEIENLKNVLYVGRPAIAQSDARVGLFKLEPDGKTARRVTVQLGRSSVNFIEVVQGLAEGDVVILSDMSQYDASDKVRLKK
ncbi:MAG: HlyD family efflux transporter periplasmic adaptor subunit [Gemmatimonadota bacterium]